MWGFFTCIAVLWTGGFRTLVRRERRRRTNRKLGTLADARALLVPAPRPPKIRAVDREGVR